MSLFARLYVESRNNSFRIVQCSLNLICGGNTSLKLLFAIFYVYIQFWIAPCYSYDNSWSVPFMLLQDSIVVMHAKENCAQHNTFVVYGFLAKDVISSYCCLPCKLLFVDGALNCQLNSYSNWNTCS